MLSTKIPKKVTGKMNWGHLPGLGLALALSTYVNTPDRFTLIITTDQHLTEKLKHELEFFLDSSFPIFIFPDRETLPYDAFSPHQDLISERLATLYHLPRQKQGIVIVNIHTLLHFLMPKAYLEQQAFILKKNDVLNLDSFRNRLVESGYYSVSQVINPGEFSIRGSIVDLFPMGNTQAFRLDLLDNEIDSIRWFDPETQRSNTPVDEISLLPAREYPLNEASIGLFRQKWRTLFPGNPANASIYNAISKGSNVSGIEYYLPLFYESLNTLFDYLPAHTEIVKMGDIDSAAQHFWHDVRDRFARCAIDYRRPLIEPELLFISTHDFFEIIKTYPQIQVDGSITDQKSFAESLGFLTAPTFLIDRKHDLPLHQLQQFLKTFTGRILFLVESAGRREALITLLKQINLSPSLFEQWPEFLANSDRFGMMISPVEQGLYIQEPEILILSETAIFGSQAIQTRRRLKTKTADADTLIRDLIELQIGSPVVHVEHGVGRYLGLTTLDIDSIQQEFLTLEYANEDKIYVPVSHLHLIHRYTGPSSDEAPLTKLGTDQWEKARKKAAEKIRDVAAEILEIHAKRAAREGFVYQYNDDDYSLFSSQFPFELTFDQEKAIQEIFQDMQSTKPMDRLVCGDVGFGKTEVAMRAAFMAIMNHKQVAVLVPTTLLAQQHFQNFCDRFAEWSVKIELLSRFRSQKEQQVIIEKLANKQIDIVIGTHKLLQKGLQFKELGLLIIDEEHRFGVQQKEALKALRTEVDILTLTATPIPRTLNMAMSGARDLSIISTPPAKRLAVKTFVLQRNPEIIRESIMRETQRGGQVYYLHNSVETILAKQRELQDLLPDITFAVAHGQMHERELERIMSDFYHQRFQVLISTTIIESGIDVPTANTIIIERADKFGLAQLHQLRGRVGRSHHQAYAYLLSPPQDLLTADAQKRLEAIANLEELGSGFILATHDLEIRGAGEILGEEQSGQIEAIGFAMYMDLLDKTVKSLKKDGTVEANIDLGTESVIELKIPTLIPEEFIGDVHLRLTLYKRISAAQSDAELDELQIEMIDRFGLLPQATKNLFALMTLKLKATELGITKIQGNIQEGYIQFSKKTPIEPIKLIQLIQLHPKSLRLAGQDRVKFIVPENQKQADLLIPFIVGLLSKMMG